MRPFQQQETDNQIVSCPSDVESLQNDQNPDDLFSAISPKRNDVVFKIVEAGKISSNQTGAFPFPSSRGYRYIMIAYDVDSNAILSRLLKTKRSIEMHVVILDLIKSLTKCYYWILDNECSKLIKDMFHDMKIKYQLVPAGTHRCNIAERVIL